jgi:hypothetical protein
VSGFGFQLTQGSKRKTCNYDEGIWLPGSAVKNFFPACHLPNAIAAHPTTTKSGDSEGFTAHYIADKKDYQGGTV